MSRRLRQPIALVQRADLRSSVCSQPRFDQPAFLDREAMADQHLAQDVIGTVDLEADGVEPGLAGVASPRSMTWATHSGVASGMTIGSSEIRLPQSVAITAASGRPTSSNQKSCGRSSVERGVRHHHCRSAASYNPAVG